MLRRDLSRWSFGAKKDTLLICRLHIPEYPYSFEQATSVLDAPPGRGGLDGYVTTGKYSVLWSTITPDLYLPTVVCFSALEIGGIPNGSCQKAGSTLHAVYRVQQYVSRQHAYHVTCTRCRE